MSESTTAIDVPTSWYNVAPDLPFALPQDLQPEPPNDAPAARDPHALRSQIPMALVRQTLGTASDVPIPEPVRDLYRAFRPTPLLRARRLEQALGTRARIYYKYEGGNVSGSHKLATAIAQAHAYRAAGARRLTTGTGAGQWGTALAVACHSFGLKCKVYMVANSFAQKPQRKTIMRLFGADVVASPSADTASGSSLLREGKVDSGNMAFAVTEALEDALANEGSHLAVGSGEAYSILHSTVIGLEARDQLAGLGEEPDVVIASLGAGSNFGGIALPFLRQGLRGSRRVRCVSVESTACPKLTRGVYRYDCTDGSGITALQKMYTLGHRFRTPGMHAGGLRYHACSKIISALYHHRWIEAVAYPQRDVFASAAQFTQLEGLLPAPESAHAVHGAVQEALRARQEGTSPVILFCLSGHGLYDLSAYSEYLDGQMESVVIDDDVIQSSLAHLPSVDA
ncbi:TrpB-like pyridoxal phosphate-dependent enzyme [Sorangium sp. So ce1024]|uniref:TrpB-like pyridoxal phosphate-dependent enzyme n=1 Tax=unclassified Sorangium TaxID=2621164 RepID=UPI003F07F862